MLPVNICHIRFALCVDLDTALILRLFQTVVASAITSGDTADYQTFDVNVHAQTIRLVPKFQRFNQWISVKEVSNHH